jgi:CIC family chloride channel protein
VVSNQGLAGVISLSILQRAHSEGAGENPLESVLETGELFPHVHDDQSLELALQRLGQAGLDVIPVVSRANMRELIGVVTLEDILKEYGVSSIVRN